MIAACFGREASANYLIQHSAIAAVKNKVRSLARNASSFAGQDGVSCLLAAMHRHQSSAVSQMLQSADKLRADVDQRVVLSGSLANAIVSKCPSTLAHLFTDWVHSLGLDESDACGH